MRFSTSKRGVARRPKAGPTGDFIEALEQRQLLTVNIADGNLVITGTPGDDVIFLEVDADDPNTLVIDDNGQTTFFDIRQLSLDVTQIVVDGGDGNDDMEAHESGGRIKLAISFFGGLGDDTIVGSAGFDWINGNEGNDSLVGGDGMDFISGGDDDDEIYGGKGADQILGGAGNDAIVGGKGNDNIQGQDGDDDIDGGDNNDVITGGQGNDTIQGGKGRDHIKGGGDDDDIDGGLGHDTIDGGDGNDTLFGNSGNDWLLGGRGDDDLDGSLGTDRLDGGLGDDLLTGGGPDNEKDFFYRGKGFSEDELQDFNGPPGGPDVLLSGSIKPDRGK